jgi:hypothetical protein
VDLYHRRQKVTSDRTYNPKVVSLNLNLTPRNQLLECGGRCQEPTLFFCAGFLCTQSGPVREPKTQVPNTGTCGTQRLRISILRRSNSPNQSPADRSGNHPALTGFHGEPSGAIVGSQETPIAPSNLVHNFIPNFTFPRSPSHYSATARFLVRVLCALFFAAIVAASAAAAAPDAPASSPPTSSAPGLSFSIADFDGDLKPDLANVESGQSDFSSTNYQIHLQLSATGRQTFQVVAPMGGLQIVASDVNGDNALDLVLTTKWLRQPVAILLNDGHGNFSRVQPGAFPEAFRESKGSWGCATDRATDAVAVPPQSREEICSETHLLSPLLSPSRFSSGLHPRFDLSAFLIFHFGRAPPSGTHSLLS